jgi:outer membrane immunogenic protein
MEKIMTFALKDTLAAIAAAALLAVPGQAAAADLGGLKDGPQPFVYAGWTGCYAGVHAGAGSGHATWQDRKENEAFFDGGLNNAGATLFRVPNTDQSGAIYGGQAGCDWQADRNWVLGIEASFSGSNISGTDQDQFNITWTLRNRVDWLGSVTGRVGWLATESTLLYARGGAAFAHNSLQVTDTGFVFTGQNSVDRTGFVIAPGIEWKFSPKASVFLQGEHYEFDDKVVHLVDPNGGPAPANAKIGQTIDALKFGVNYRF